MAASILADILVPHFGIGRDPVAQHLDAALVGQVDDLDAVLAQPRNPAVEVHQLAHHHGADVELPHQAAAVPARGERGDHARVAVAALESGLADGVGFAGPGRVALVHEAGWSGPDAAVG